MALVDFLYLGETKLPQEHIESFLAIAEDLKIKGLMGGSAESIVPREARQMLTELDGCKTNQEQNLKPESERSQESNDDKIFSSLNPEKSAGVSKIKKDTRRSLLVDADLTASYCSDALNELDAKVNSFTQLVNCSEEEGGEEGKGRQRLNICTVCNKIGHKTHIKDHIEAKHLEGISILCNHCGQNFRTRSAMRHHTKKLHREELKN